MIRLFVLVALVLPLSLNAANFPFIRLNNTTNRISDNGSALTRNGVAITTPVGANPTATVATTAVNGSASTFMRSDASPAIPASFIQANQTNVAAANPTATATASIQNGSATTFMRSDASPALPQALSSTSSPTFNLLTSSDILSAGYSVSRSTLTHAGTVTLDCGITNRYASITLTGNVTFATANLTAGKWYNVIITMTSTNDTPTFPAWKWLGGAPSTLTGGQIGVLSIYPTSPTDATTLAAYTETQ